tara:strand:+ start:2016 stop:2273 length:258 start_codon:yes stop_codon:yes gene_type:complete
VKILTHIEDTGQMWIDIIVRYIEPAAAFRPIRIISWRTNGAVVLAPVFDRPEGHDHNHRDAFSTYIKHAPRFSKNHTQPPREIGS